MGNLRDGRGLDTERGVVRVEPGVDVGAATRYLVPRGYMRKVTLEIAEATLGGLCMAVGMTTHSHRAGLIQDTVESYEVVLADGSCVRAARTGARGRLQASLLKFPENGSALAWDAPGTGFDSQRQLLFL